MSLIKQLAFAVFVLSVSVLPHPQTLWAFAGEREDRSFAPFLALDYFFFKGAADEIEDDVTTAKDNLAAVPGVTSVGGDSDNNGAVGARFGFLFPMRGQVP